MQDYYSILRVSQNAGESEIKSSYKKLALTYHPDRNPGNPHAEEEFKLINEAYQTLSDPHKKANYDNMLLYNEYHRKSSTYSDSSSPYRTPNRRGPIPRRKRYGKYIIDDEYYRIQKIILGIFFTLVATAYISYQLKMYFREQAKIKAKIAENMMIDSVHVQLNNLKMEDALQLLFKFIDRQPMNYRFYAEKDSVLELIEDRAERMYRIKNYEESALMFGLLRKYSTYNSPSSLEPFLYSFIRTNQPDSAIAHLNRMLLKDSINITAHYMLSKIYFEELDQLDKAEYFIDHSKRIFKKIQTKRLGRAFEVIMNPDETADIFFDVFELRSRINMKKGDFEEAYTDANWCVFLRPTNVLGYEYRIECAKITGDFGYICYDFNQVKDLGKSINTNDYKKYCNT